MTEYEAALRAICPLKIGMKNSHSHHMKNYPTNFQLLLPLTVHWTVKLYSAPCCLMWLSQAGICYSSFFLSSSYFSYFFSLIVKQLSYSSNEKAEF